MCMAATSRYAMRCCSLVFSWARLRFSLLARSSSVDTVRPSLSFCSSVLWMIAMSSLIPEMSGEQNCWPATRSRASKEDSRRFHNHGKGPC